MHLIAYNIHKTLVKIVFLDALLRLKYRTKVSELLIVKSRILTQICLIFHSMMTQPSIIYSSALKISERTTVASVKFQNHILSRVILFRKVHAYKRLEESMSVICSCTFSFKVIPLHMKPKWHTTATASLVTVAITASSHQCHWWLLHDCHVDPLQLSEFTCQLLHLQENGPCQTSGFWISFKCI